MSHLNGMMREVQKCNEANGWFDDDRTFEADIALLHSEVSEAFEAYRDHGHDDATNYNSTGKPEGIGSELADVLVRLLDTCYRYDIDLQWEFDRKMDYNRTRSYRHGGKRV